MEFEFCNIFKFNTGLCEYCFKYIKYKVWYSIEKKDGIIYFCSMNCMWNFTHDTLRKSNGAK
jgi:hypothetical protein